MESVPMRTRKDGKPDGRSVRRIMTATEREGLKRELATIESDRSGDIEGIPRRMRGFIDRDVDINRGVMDAREKRIRGVLAAGEPEPLTNEERSKLSSKEAELRDRLVKRMITKKMMQLKPGSLDFTKARNMLAKNEMSAEFNRDVAAWKNMRRQMNPDDPDFANLEAIRPE